MRTPRKKLNAMLDTLEEAYNLLLRVTEEAEKLGKYPDLETRLFETLQDLTSAEDIIEEILRK